MCPSPVPAFLVCDWLVAFTSRAGEGNPCTGHADNRKRKEPAPRIVAVVAVEQESRASRGAITWKSSTGLHCVVMRCSADIDDLRRSWWHMAYGISHLPLTQGITQQEKSSYGTAST